MKKMIFLLLCFMFLLCGCGQQQMGSKLPVDFNSPEEIEEELREILDGMSLEEKVSQMFLVRCPEQQSLDMVRRYQFGGYIFFGRDFEDSNPSSFIKELTLYREASKVPMFFAVDEEGGTVKRISQFEKFSENPFLSPQEVYASGGMTAVRKDTQHKAELLKYLGINLNLAPVCDVSTDPKDFIYERSFGKSAEETADYVQTVVAESHKGGVGSCLKHFPGYGNNTDTHTGVAYDERPYETFITSDFLPFEAGIRAGSGMVMVSHNVVRSMDTGMPASLSEEVHRILRQELDFDGVIVTDDLAMDAIGDFTDDKSAVVLAVLAGNDMICCSNFAPQIQAVLEAVESEEIPEERIDESVMRILRYKKQLGLLKRSYFGKPALQ